MPSYICEKCGYIENSACGGNYWAVKGKLNLFKDKYANTHLLCSQCTPKEYKDGSIKKDDGIHIERRHWSEIGKERILKSCEADIGNFTNAKEYFEKLGKRYDVVNAKEYVEKVCNHCLNKANNEDLCQIVRRINGEYWCSNEKMQNELEDKVR